MRAKRIVARPKKPLSAYIYFSQDNREIMKEQHAELSSLEMMKHVSYKWNLMSQEEKHAYNILATEDKIRYDKELL